MFGEADNLLGYRKFHSRNVAVFFTMAPSTYHFKCAKAGGSWTATAFGEKAEGMDQVSAADMNELKKELFTACKTKSGVDTFTYQCDMVTPTQALFTAVISD